MAASIYRKQQKAKQKSLLSELICRTLEVQPSDENHDIAMDFCLQNLEHHRFGDTNPPAIDRMFASLESKLHLHSQMGKSRRLWELRQQWMSVPLSKDVYDVNHAVLQVLLSLAGRPLDTDMQAIAQEAHLVTLSRIREQPYPDILTPDQSSDGEGPADQWDSSSQLSDWSAADDICLDPPPPITYQQTASHSMPLSVRPQESELCQLLAALPVLDQPLQPAPEQPQQLAPKRATDLAARLAGGKFGLGGQPFSAYPSAWCVTDAYLAQQVLRLLQGQGGELFPWDDTASCFRVRPEVHVPYLSHGSSHSMLAEFAVAGTHARHLLAFCDHVEAVHSGAVPIQQGMLDASHHAAHHSFQGTPSCVGPTNGDPSPHPSRQGPIPHVPTSSSGVTALTAALRSQLRAALQPLAELERSNLAAAVPGRRPQDPATGTAGAATGGRGLTLLALKQLGLGPMRRLRLLEGAARYVAADLPASAPQASAAVIDRLEDLVTEAGGSGGPTAWLDQSLLLHLLLSSLQPLVAALQVWLLEGEMYELPTDFFVTPAKKLAAQDPGFWSDAYQLCCTADGKGTPACPRFLRPLAHSILAAGKSLRLMQVLGASSAGSSHMNGYGSPSFGVQRQPWADLWDAGDLLPVFIQDASDFLQQFTFASSVRPGPLPDQGGHGVHHAGATGGDAVAQQAAASSSYATASTHSRGGCQSTYTVDREPRLDVLMADAGFGSCQPCPAVPAEVGCLWLPPWTPVPAPPTYAEHTDMHADGRADQGTEQQVMSLDMAVTAEHNPIDALKPDCSEEADTGTAAADGPEPCMEQGVVAQNQEGETCEHADWNTTGATGDGDVQGSTALPGARDTTAAPANAGDASSSRAATRSMQEAGADLRGDAAAAPSQPLPADDEDWPGPTPLTAWHQGMLTRAAELGEQLDEGCRLLGAGDWQARPPGAEHAGGLSLWRRVAEPPQWLQEQQRQQHTFDWLLAAPALDPPPVADLLHHSLLLHAKDRIDEIGDQLLGNLLGSWGLMQELRSLRNLFLLASPAMDAWSERLLGSCLGGTMLDECREAELESWLQDVAVLVRGEDALPPPDMVSAVIDRDRVTKVREALQDAAEKQQQQEAASMGSVTARRSHSQTGEGGAGDAMPSAGPPPRAGSFTAAGGSFSSVPGALLGPRSSGLLPSWLQRSVTELSGLALQYHGGWLLSLVADTGALQAYNTALVFLLQIKWARMALDRAKQQLWKLRARSRSQSCAAAPANAASQAARRPLGVGAGPGLPLPPTQPGAATSNSPLQPVELQLVVTEMMHFVSNLQQFVMDRLLYGAWAALERALEVARTLDDVRTAHSAFVAALLRQCCASDEPGPGATWRHLGGTILKILDAVLRFTTPLQHCLMLLQQHQGSTLPANAAAAMQQLARAAQEFRERQGYMLRLLTAKTLKLGGDTEIGYLVMRLNYNRFYLPEFDYDLLGGPPTHATRVNQP